MQYEFLFILVMNSAQLVCTEEECDPLKCYLNGIPYEINDTVVDLCNTCVCESADNNTTVVCLICLENPIR